MVSRCIFFQRNNMLYKKTIKVMWDNDAMELNKLLCSKAIYEQATPSIYPCVDVSGNTKMLHGKLLNIFNVKNEQGKSFKDIMTLLDADPNKADYPISCYDLIYLRSLNEKQIAYALSGTSYYDIYYNPKKDMFTPAKAIPMLQLLYHQGKIDYLNDNEKFVYWYLMNYTPIEWNDKIER